MLNMNRYDQLTDLFKYGVNIDLGMMSLNRYHEGQIRGKLSFGKLVSPGTGHWPFQLLDINFITGEHSAWQVTVLGLTVGSRRVHDTDESGMLQGPDYSETYCFFSGLNHKSKTLEEIINYAD